MKKHTIPVYLSDACKLAVERADALGYKGKRADAFALDYLIGVAVGARAAGDEAIARHIETVAATIIAVRGMFEVRVLANRADVLADYREECKADAQSGRAED